MPRKPSKCELTGRLMAAPARSPERRIRREPQTGVSSQGKRGSAHARDHGGIVGIQRPARAQQPLRTVLCTQCSTLQSEGHICKDGLQNLRARKHGSPGHVPKQVHICSVLTRCECSLDTNRCISRSTLPLADILNSSDSSDVTSIVVSNLDAFSCAHLLSPRL